MCSRNFLDGIRNKFSFELYCFGLDEVRFIFTRLLVFRIVIASFVGDLSEVFKGNWKKILSLKLEGVGFKCKFFC